MNPYIYIYIYLSHHINVEGAGFCLYIIIFVKYFNIIQL